MDLDLFDALRGAGYAASTAARLAQPASPRYAALRKQLDSGEPITKGRSRPGREKRIQKLLDAGYTPTTATTYAGRNPKLLPPRARVALGLSTDETRAEVSARRAAKVDKLIAAGYAGTTASAYASTPASRLPPKARRALGFESDPATGRVPLSPAEQRLVDRMRRKLDGTGARYGDLKRNGWTVRFQEKVIIGSRDLPTWELLAEKMDPLGAV